MPSPSERATPPLVAVYADESCLGNGREGQNPGGAGVLVEFALAGGDIVRRDLWISEPATTNNRMALRSVIEACRSLSGKGARCEVIFTTDSRYIVDGMSTWVHDWAKRGWRRKTGAIENVELWREAVAAAAAHDIMWRWVKGHAGHTQNEYANDLAVRGATEQTQSGGLIPSGFDEWLQSRTALRRAIHLEGFPQREEFRVGRRLPAVG